LTLPVLHRRDREELARGLDLLDRDLAQAGMADQPFLLHLCDDAELLVARHLGIDAVELPELDALLLQPTQTHHHALAQVFRPADQLPAVRPAAREAAFGGDDHVLAGRQRLGGQGHRWKWSDGSVRAAHAAVVFRDVCRACSNVYEVAPILGGL